MKTEIQNQISVFFTDFVLPSTTHCSLTQLKKKKERKKEQEKKGKESLQTCCRSYTLEVVYPVFVDAVKKRKKKKK